MTDIIDDFLTRITNHVPDLPLDVRLRVESDLRHTWGGSTIQKTTYVEKGIRGYGKETRAMLVSMGLQNRTPLPQIMQNIGVTSRTGFRMLGKKSRP